MKKSTLLVVALTAAGAFAAPMYYTFVGTIGFVPEDRGGYAAAHNIRPGSTVNLVFVADTAREAFTKFQGVVKLKPDISNPGYAANNFFDSLLTPSLFSGAVTDSASGSYLGYRITTTVGTRVSHSFQLQVTTGNPDKRAQVILSFPDSGRADWMPRVGDKAAGTETYIDSSVASSSATMTLTCTAVSSTRPNGIRARAIGNAHGMRAVSRGESVYFENRTGKMVTVAIMDASGKTVLSRSIGGRSEISLRSLPRGELFLEAKGPGGSLRQALYR